jgi:C-terminal processing protease CtpA/Prc
MRHARSGAVTTLLVWVAFASTASAQGYDPARRYPVDQLKQDLALLRGALEEAHPSLHWYVPEFELEAAFDRASAALVRPMTERELHSLLAPVVTLVRDGHTALDVSQALEEWVGSRRWPYLPFSLWLDRDQLNVLNNASSDPSIQPGDRLLEVNGLATASLVSTARQLVSGDGFGETWRDFHLNFGSLRRVAAHNLDITEPFTVTLQRPDGRRYTTTVTRAKPGDGPPPRKPPHDFRVLDDGAALFTINGFGYPDAAAVHVPVFKEVAARNVRHLIIDLRENSGGNGDLVVDLMRYLVDRPFRLLAGSWARLRRPDRPSFARHLDARTTKQLQDNNRFIRSEGGRHHFDNDALGVKQPSPQYPYRGAVYLLTSGRTFSSASLFVASLKAQRKVTVIGEETGGGEAGFSAGINQRVTLPHTRLRLRLPLFRLMSASTAPNRGRGVMPDHAIHYGWREKLAGKDLELARALELVAASPPALQ